MSEDGVGRRAFIAGAAATAMAACSPSRSARPPIPASSASSSAASPSAPTAATFVSSGPTTHPLVALTFHVSGDRALAVRLLDLLRSRKTVITAFMVGTFVDQHPDLISTFVADGHEIANHTYSHLGFASLPREQMTTEIVRCRDALARTTGSGGRLFRPSGTANGTDAPSAVEVEIARAAGYALVVGYDVDPADYADPGASAVATRTTGALRAGSIASLHFGHQGTIDALPHILDAIDRAGLRPATLTEMLSA